MHAVMRVGDRQVVEVQKKVVDQYFKGFILSPVQERIVDPNHNGIPIENFTSVPLHNKH